MVPFFTKVRIDCERRNVSFDAVLLAHELGVPLNEIDTTLEAARDPERMQLQKRAVFRAYVDRMMRPASENPAPYLYDPLSST